MDEYKTGYPNKKGWYDCKIEGEPIRLYHNFCELSMKHKWVMEDGGVIVDPSIVWKEKES